MSGQEHCEIASLWRLQEPDILIMPDADIAAASEAAHLTIDTTPLDPQVVIDKVVGFLETRNQV